MRAKNEYKFIAEAYDTKLLLERIVDGTLMCPEACCGAPVMECKCGPDCPHCNCHEIQKLAKKDKTINERNGFYKMRDPDGDGSWPDDDDDRSDDPNYGEPEQGGGYMGEDEDGEGAAGHLRSAAARGAVQKDRVRLTLDSPGTASVHLPEGDPRIQKYLDKGYKIVKDYKKAEQDEETDEQIRRRGGYGDKDDPLWKRQMDNRPKVSPEIEEDRVQVGSQVMWDRQRQHGIVDELDDPENPTVAFVLDDDGAESIVDVENLEVISGPIEDAEDHPKQGITGLQYTNALAQAALSKDYKHKPYVSSYVGGESDGFRKIFAILGSDGKVVHKTRDKREAHQWLKDNYENI